MSLRTDVAAFLRYCSASRQLSERTVRAYAHDLDDLRRFVGARVAAGDVSTETLSRYLEDMLGRRRLTPSTVRRRFACLRAFFRFTSEREKFADPFATLKLKLPRRKRLPRALSRPEISSLIASLPAPSA